MQSLLYESSLTIVKITYLYNAHIVPSSLKFCRERGIPFFAKHNKQFNKQKKVIYIYIELKRTFRSRVPMLK